MPCANQGSIENSFSQPMGLIRGQNKLFCPGLIPLFKLHDVLLWLHFQSFLNFIFMLGEMHRYPGPALHRHGCTGVGWESHHQCMQEWWGKLGLTRPVKWCLWVAGQPHLPRSADDVIIPPQEPDVALFIHSCFVPSVEKVLTLLFGCLYWVILQRKLHSSWRQWV